MRQVFDKIRHWLSQELPFCVYKKPNSQIINGVFQSNDFLHTTSEFTEEGFVFAPFDLSRPTVLLRPDELLKTTYQPEEKRLPIAVTEFEEGKDFHLNLIKKGLQEIKSGNLKKIVLSREIQTQTLKQPDEILWGLIHHYENAFCYLFFHPKIGMWCGATPETLVSIKHKQLMTVSLAGTLPIDKENPVKWTEKEKEEQRLVTDYVRNQLSLKLKNVEIGAVQTVQAGKLWHLKTKIAGELNTDATVADIVRLIHPTPAVCGIPTKDSVRFILENEGYDRRFYTGFLGELNLADEEEASFFVNLRCMELEGHRARVFVGGGITLDSKPESEWIETQNKSQTILSLL